MNPRTSQLRIPGPVGISVKFSPRCRGSRIGTTGTTATATLERLFAPHVVALSQRLKRRVIFTPLFPDNARLTRFCGRDSFSCGTNCVVSFAPPSRRRASVVVNSQSAAKGASNDVRLRWRRRHPSVKRPGRSTKERCRRTRADLAWCLRSLEVCPAK